MEMINLLISELLQISISKDNNVFKAQINQMYNMKKQSFCSSGYLCFHLRGKRSLFIFKTKLIVFLLTI